MRWLLLKDLRILRRSPLTVAILVAYPIVIALLIGLALSRGPDRPKVAIVNAVPRDEQTVQVGSQRIDTQRYARRLLDAVDPVPARTRAEALAKVRSGEVLGALIVPADVTQRLQAALNLSGSAARPTLEVAYSLQDPLGAQIVESTIKARLADANAALSEQLTDLAARYIGILQRGGGFSLLGQSFDVLGLERSERILRAALRRLPPGSPEAREVRRVADFARIAADNLGLSRGVLDSVGRPISLRRTVLSGRATPLDAFAVSVSVTISLMFVTVLLAAGLLALEREEHAFGRLVRGLVSRTTLLGEKVLLSAACALLAGLALLGGIGLFVGPRLEPGGALARRPRRRGGRLRGARGRDRRARARGPRRVAARLPARRCRSPSSRSSPPVRSPGRCWT